jgi:hypothetical protein
MIKHLTFITLFLIPILAFPQDEKRKPVRIEGKIMDSDQQPVSFAHIINRARKIGTTSDYYGRFSLGSYPGDTLTISAISYQKLNVIIPDTITRSLRNLIFVMSPDTILLQEQVIYPWPGTYDEFKREFLETRIRDTVEPFIMRSWFQTGELTNLAYPEGGIRFPGPISLLHSLFSKKSRIQKELQRIRLQEKVSERYNIELISKVTGMTDTLMINKLIVYCDLDPGFISRASDYELYAEIYSCYNDFIQNHGQ